MPTQPPGSGAGRDEDELCSEQPGTGHGVERRQHPRRHAEVRCEQHVRREERRDRAHQPQAQSRERGCRDREHRQEDDHASRASFTSRSASSLCSRVTWRYSTVPILRASPAACKERSRSASFLTRYSPRICFTSNSESETTSTAGTASSSARSRPATSARYSATLFVAMPIRSPCDASTVPSSASSTYAKAAGPGLPRAPPSV